MKNLQVRLGMAVVAVAALGPAWACFSNSSTETGTQGTSPNADAGSGASSSQSSSSASSSAPSVFVDTNPVIDDMTGQQSELGGSWYTYSDRTVPNSEPPAVLASNPPGYVQPAEGAPFFPDSTLVGPTINDAGVALRMADGGGETDWGAGFGMDLVSQVPSGGPSIFSVCPNGGDGGLNGGPLFDTDPDAGNTGIPQPVDAGAYTGIGFYARSLAGSTSLYVQIDDNRTTPWGGLCDACVSSGTCKKSDAGLAGCPCSDSFRYKVLLTSAWTHYEVHFSQMTTQDWSDATKDGYMGDSGINQTAIYNFHLQDTLASSGTPLTPFSIQVAYVTWLTD